MEKVECWIAVSVLEGPFVVEKTVKCGREPPRNIAAFLPGPLVLSFEGRVVTPNGYGLTAHIKK